MSRYLTVSIVICDREPIPTYADDLDVLGGRSAIAIVNGGETESGGAVDTKLNEHLNFDQMNGGKQTSVVGYLPLASAIVR